MLIMRIIGITASVVMLIGVGIMLYSFATEEERTVLSIDLEKTGADGFTMEFNDLCMLPGESDEYTLELSNYAVDQYKLHLDFFDKAEDMTLKNFARVKIVANSGVVCDKLLADALKEDEIVLDVDFDTKQNLVLKFIYYLPIETGNDAKLAEAKFGLTITATNE
jgi:hypothetical protein